MRAEISSRRRTVAIRVLEHVAWSRHLPMGVSRRVQIALFLVLLLSPLPCLAQTEKEIDEALSKLSSTSQGAIKALESLRSLPAEDWRFHAGNLPHGESLDLEDTAWEIRRPGSIAPSGTVWYRRIIEVPANLHGYDLTGSRVWFQFWTGVDGPMTEIVYFNGRRVAMGDNLEPIVLFDNCKPGDKVLVAVKLLETIEQKGFAGAALPIDAPTARPSPGDLYQELVSAAMLIPSLQGGAFNGKQIVDAAAQAITVDALRSGHQEEFDTSLRKSSGLLSPLTPLLRQLTYHLTGNSHIDAAWLWPWTDSIEAVRHTWSTALQLMREYPNYTFTQSAARYNTWMAEKYPMLNDEIRQRVDEGRWEIVGGMWIEPELNMPEGESLVRQLLVGTRAFRELYGVDVHIAWNPDSFGYNWQLPQIYKRSGMDYFVTQNPSRKDTNSLPLKLFWWESPDGSKVLTYFPHDYDNGDVHPTRLAADMVEARENAPGLLEMMDLYGIGDHGGGASRFILEEADHWQEPNKIVPQVQMGTAQSFFEQLRPKLDAISPEWNYRVIAAGKPELATPSTGKIRIPTWKDELFLEYNQGTYTTQANHKQEMRQGEINLLNAEKLAAWAWLDGASYPQLELTEAWKKVLFNQFHDLAAGSGVANIYKDAMKDFNEVGLETDKVSRIALHEIESHVNTQGPGVPIIIFNTLAWPRSGIATIDVEVPAVTSEVHVVDADHSVLPSLVLRHNPRTNTFRLLVEIREIPAMGYEIVHVLAGARPVVTDLVANGFQMENSRLRVRVDPKTGCLTSLYDKRAKFEALTPGTCGNELVAFKDTPKEADAWDIAPDFDKVFTNLDQADSVSMVEHTSLRAVIRVTRHWQSSRFIQDYVLYVHSDQLEVRNDFDWQEDHVLLKAAFTLAAHSDMATYEIPYGSIERPTTRRNSWERAKFEVPALRWADSGDALHGFSLLNDSKYGYDAVGNRLRLSLLRSPTWPDPKADRGPHQFSYALYPHPGTWKEAMTVRHGYEFNYGLRGDQVFLHSGALAPKHSFLDLQAPNVTLTTMKKSEDGDALILRLYEWMGKEGNVTLSLPGSPASAMLTNLMEKESGANLAISPSGEIMVPVRPYEIVTLRVNYPEKEH